MRAGLCTMMPRNLAGEVGFEPTSPVLETGSLATELTLLQTLERGTVIETAPLPWQGSALPLCEPRLAPRVGFEPTVC